MSQEFNQFYYFIINFPAQVAAFAVAVAFVLRIDPSPFVTRLVAALAISVVVIIVYSLLTVYPFSPLIGMDHRIFWGAGKEVWAGQNPSAILNPPTALPLFAGFAVLPGRLSFFVFTI